VSGRKVVVIDSELHAKLKRMAGEKGYNLGRLTEMLIKRGLDNSVPKI
jgi:hypothetical protein